MKHLRDRSDLLGEGDPSSALPGCCCPFLFPHNGHQLPEGFQDILSICQTTVWNAVGTWSSCTSCSALSTSVHLCRPFSGVLPGWPLTLRDFLSSPMSAESSQNWRGPCRSMIFFSSLLLNFLRMIWALFYIVLLALQQIYALLLHFCGLAPLLSYYSHW